MKVFFSAADAEHIQELLLRQGAKNWLASYYYLRKGSGKIDHLYDLKKKHGLFLLLDSGAFSIAQIGGSVDIDDYIAFCKEHESLFDIRIGLDVIGDEEGTWRNCSYMLDRGVMNMITWHHKEPFQVLKRYMESDFEWVGIGDMAGKPPPTPFLIRCFRDVFREFADENGKLPKKVHGLGLGIRWPIFEQFPFYSVDSTSYLEGAKRAICFTRWGLVQVSHRADVMGKGQMTFLSLPKPQQDELEGEFNKAGWTLEQMILDPDARTEWNVRYTKMKTDHLDVSFRDDRVLLFGRDFG